MNRMPILAGAAGVAMLLAQASFAAGCKAPWAGSWGPHGGYGPWAKPYPHYRGMPHHRGPWAKPGYRPSVPQRMAPPGWRTGGIAPPAAATGAAAASAGTPAVEPAAPADSATVTVSQMRFGPNRVVVEKGATVTWNFQDGMPHTVTAVDGGFDSGRLSAGGQFSHTFDQPGTFAYYCALHPSMRGEVVVVE